MGQIEGGAPPTLAVILMDDAGGGRGLRGLHLPWITSRPISSPLPPQLGNQSSNFVGIHHWIASSQIHQPFFEAASLFDRGTAASLPCEPSQLLPQQTRFYLHLARNSRFPSRFNLLLSFSRFSVGISPAADLEKDELNTQVKGETFQKSKFLSWQ